MPARSAGCIRRIVDPVRCAAPRTRVIWRKRTPPVRVTFFARRGDTLSAMGRPQQVRVSHRYTTHTRYVCVPSKHMLRCLGAISRSYSHGWLGSEKGPGAQHAGLHKTVQPPHLLVLAVEASVRGASARPLCRRWVMRAVYKPGGASFARCAFGCARFGCCWRTRADPSTRIVVDRSVMIASQTKAEGPAWRMRQPVSVGAAGD
jgi:hypothetical protein